MNFLSFEEYKNNAITINNSKKNVNWIQYEERWEYHKKAINFAKELNLEDPKKVLELGSFGASIVKDSISMDFNLGWNLDNFKPNYYHDARKIPWPIEDKQFDLFVALRVYQHLYPVQKEAFLEAKRIAKNIIIVVPETYFGGKTGITFDDFTKWNNNKPPTNYEKIDDIFGYIYYWKGI